MLKSKLLRTVSLIMVTVGLLVLGSTTAFAQSKTVTGKVVDANGPVIGAFVMEQGTNTGASTVQHHSVRAKSCACLFFNWLRQG